MFALEILIRGRLRFKRLYASTRTETLRATSGAVSVLNTRGPSRMAENPFSDAIVSPRAPGHPPAQSAGQCLRVDHSMHGVLPQGPTPTCSQPDVGKPLGQRCRRWYPGTTARPLCSQALMTICCQCSCFCRSGDRRTSTRWLSMGMMEVTPSSVAFFGPLKAIALRHG